MSPGGAEGGDGKDDEGEGEAEEEEEEEAKMANKKGESTMTVYGEEYHSQICSKAVYGSRETPCESCTTINSLPNIGDLEGSTSQVIGNKKIIMEADAKTGDKAIAAPSGGDNSSTDERADVGKVGGLKLAEILPLMSLKQNYINNEQLSKYLILMERWVRTEPGSAAACQLLFPMFEFLNPIRSGSMLDVSFQMSLFERLNGELELFIKDVFIIVTDHYFLIPQGIFREVDMELDRGQIQHLVASLYPNFPQLYDFFQLFESMKLFIAKNLLQELIIEGDPKNDFGRLVLRKMPYFFESRPTHEHPEVMRMLYEMCLNTLRCYNKASGANEFGYDQEHFGKLVDRSVLIFLMHSTIDSKLCSRLCSQLATSTFRLFDAKFGKDNPAHPSRLEPTSVRMVQLLYQITVLLASIANVYDGGYKYLQSLLAFDMKRKCSQFFYACPTTYFVLNIANKARLLSLPVCLRAPLSSTYEL